MSSADALDLDALRELCAAATEGPWTWSGVYLEGGPSGYRDVISPGDVKCGSYCQGGTSVVEIASADADFIAAARSAVPALIAEVERLTQQRDSAREWAVRLEQQNAEALRIATTRLDDPNARGALFVIQRILGAFPDDETEQQ